MSGKDTFEEGFVKMQGTGLGRAQWVVSLCKGTWHLQMHGTCGGWALTYAWYVCGLGTYGCKVREEAGHLRI